MRIVAIVCVRNEAPYLKVVVPYLQDEGIDIVLIDNESDDETANWLQSKRYPGIVKVVRFPYSGTFDLSTQLNLKQELAAELDADWLIHQDADEILHSPVRWGGLRASIETADTAGFNVVNFNELVMLPRDPASDDFLNNSSNYYFFEPRPLRLMRAWKKSANLILQRGGHVLAGADVNVSPERMILKHFIVRSQEHAFQKYLKRSFSSADLEKGWHGNRLAFTRDNLTIPVESPRLHRLSHPTDAPAELPLPESRHFWQWRSLR